MSKESIKTISSGKIPKKRVAWNKYFVGMQCNNPKCEAIFEVPYWKINQGRGQYCSKKCADICHVDIGTAAYRYVPPKGITPAHFRTYCGSENYNWKGGRFLDKSGYVMVNSPKHPNKNGRGYVQEHRLVVEELMGRFLKTTESVHHIDKNRKNNHPSNLIVFESISAHRRFEEGSLVHSHEIVFYVVCQKKQTKQDIAERFLK